VSELRSAVEGLRAESLAELPDARIEEDFAELQRVGELLEVERLRRLAEIERRCLFQRDGHLSAASWLADRFRVTWSVARTSTRVARALEEMPATRRALASGDVSMSAARMLVDARQPDRSAFERSENELVEAARRHSITGLRRVTSYWRQQIERDRIEAGDDVLYARRRLHASVTFQGMVRVDGDLDPESGEALLTALRAVMDADLRRIRGEPVRTHAQRRADALHQICSHWLSTPERPKVAGERPHVTVTVAAEALSNPPKGAGELDHLGAVPAEVARRLGCDASVMRVVLAGASQPLDVGRRTAVVPHAIRRAVIVRDRRCRFPGCDRPHPWCDAHHVVHWADGGSTSLQNLLLLCRRHHRMVHDPAGFGLTLVGGRPLFRRPDGSILDGGEDDRRAPEVVLRP
jgi:Domain of unknown function (DUF222)/HNH endonuclease